jgi:hypothetical protein
MIGVTNLLHDEYSAAHGLRITLAIEAIGVHGAPPEGSATSTSSATSPCFRTSVASGREPRRELLQQLFELVWADGQKIVAVRPTPAFADLFTGAAAASQRGVKGGSDGTRTRDLRRDRFTGYGHIVAIAPILRALGRQDQAR